jgi:hypothetical protein
MLFLIIIMEVCIYLDFSFTVRSPLLTPTFFSLFSHPLIHRLLTSTIRRKHVHGRPLSMIKEEGRSNKKYEGNQRTPPSAFTITNSRQMFLCGLLTPPF